MSNGEQMAKAIEDAQEQLARDGYLNAPTNVVHLAATGFLAKKIDLINERSLVVRFEGKKMLGICVATGALLVGILEAIIR